MKNDKMPKKYKKPTHKIDGVNLAYIGSISGLVLTMAVVLIVVPNLNKNDSENVYSGANTSDTSSTSREFAQTVEDWFSNQVPTDNPIASSLSSSISTESTKSGKSEPQSTVTSTGKTSTISTSETVSSRTSQSTISGSSAQQSALTSTSSAQSTMTSTPVEIPEPPVEPNANSDKVVYDKDGIVIVGTRAFSLYSSGTGNCANYANVLNKFKANLPNVNVYSLVMPTACEFYSPPEIAERCTSQLANINAINRNLKNVTPVDAYSELKKHTNEPIYLRTDHHWAPLGGYYSAKAFAEAAGVPFLPLSDYTEKVNTGYVGTMYGYTNKSAILKNNPENFVYHIPKTVDYTTTYYNYKMSGGSISGAYAPMEAAFFLDFGDNSSNNYCTFMGGDAKIVHVKTSIKNGRRLAIFKDSFGNTIPGYLFGSFEEIYVLDIRYFSHNAIDFMKQKQITDLLFANNTTVTANASMTSKIDKLITQADMGF
ncbi:MAG: DHHW family protein [Oscillospiraceae bacterium]